MRERERERERKRERDREREKEREKERERKEREGELCGFKSKVACNESICRQSKKEKSKHSQVQK